MELQSICAGEDTPCDRLVRAVQIEKDEHYIKTVVKLAGIVEDMVKCNNAVDIYEQYFPEVGAGAAYSCLFEHEALQCGSSNVHCPSSPVSLLLPHCLTSADSGKCGVAGSAGACSQWAARAQDGCAAEGSMPWVWAPCALPFLAPRWRPPPCRGLLHHGSLCAACAAD
jgi:hypothetical protein